MKIRIGIVPPWRSGNVEKVQPMITKKYNDAEIDKMTLLPNPVGPVAPNLVKDDAAYLAQYCLTQRRRKGAYPIA